MKRITKIPKKRFPIQPIALVIFGLGLGMIANQIKPKSPTFIIPWREQPVQLTDVEQATMSGNFQEEFQTAQNAETSTPRPMVDQPLAETNRTVDVIPPTVTISGEPPCFSLWVNDNMTPWQQLVTRSKLDNGQWSTWMNYYSYCFDNLEVGAHTLSIQIKDLAGNMSSEVKYTFTVKR